MYKNLAYSVGPTLYIPEYTTGHHHLGSACGHVKKISVVDHFIYTKIHDPCCLLV